MCLMREYILRDILNVAHGDMESKETFKISVKCFPQQNYCGIFSFPHNISGGNMGDCPQCSYALPRIIQAGPMADGDSGPRIRWKLLTVSPAP